MLWAGPARRYGNVCWQAEVLLDAGANRDVFAGMQLFATHRDAFLTATVTALGSSESLALFTGCFDPDELFDMPQRGWQFTTRGPLWGEEDVRDAEAELNATADEQQSTSD